MGILNELDINKLKKAGRLNSEHQKIKRHMEMLRLDMFSNLDLESSDELNLASLRDSIMWYSSNIQYEFERAALDRIRGNLTMNRCFPYYNFIESTFNYLEDLERNNPKEFETLKRCNVISDMTELIQLSVILGLSLIFPCIEGDDTIPTTSLHNLLFGTKDLLNAIEKAREVFLIIAVVPLKDQQSDKS